MFPDDHPGREVATIVANEYPTLFLTHTWKATEKMEARIAKIYPYVATCVAVFLFHLGGKETIISVGDVETYLWDGTSWYKPKEISDHWLDVTVYETNAARFFGSSKHKADPRFPGIFSAEPDVLKIKPGIPVIFATDGIKDVLKIDDINTLPVNPTKHAAKAIVKTILDEVTRRGTQRDDISIFVRTSQEHIKHGESLEDRLDERDAAALFRKDRGEGIPIKNIGKKYRFTID